MLASGSSNSAVMPAGAGAGAAADGSTAVRAGDAGASGAETDGSGTGLVELGYLGGVAALSFSPDERLIYAGIGARILAYSTLEGTLLATRRVFAHGKIHGFTFQRQQAGGGGGGSESVAVFGQKSVSALVARRGDDHGCSRLEVAARFPTMSDWVLNLAFLPCVERGGRLLIGFAHNRVELWCYPGTVAGSAPPQAVCTHSVLADERCFLYSLAFLVEPANPDSALVASGTVFGSVVLWKVSLPSEADASVATATEIARLGPHPGVIVRLAFSADGTSLCSASDDRSVKVWRRGTDGQYTERHTLEGHLARVWDCVAATSQCATHETVVSCGEDGTCRVWDMASGQQLVSMEGHLGRLWRSSVATELQLVATGGEDSSIKVWPLLRADSLLPQGEESKRTYTLQDPQSPNSDTTCYSDSKSECVK
eukprot:COSAG06_NODE_458_length_15468_cov_5.851074_10_plen_425_part_01